MSEPDPLHHPSSKRFAKGHAQYHIMIVEDEYWTARDLTTEAHDRGATVIGPTSHISQAFMFLEQERRPDAVILDVQLRSKKAFPLADLMMKAGIPFLFATGYEKNELPKRFKNISHMVKPFSSRDCIDAVLALASGQPQKLP
jgi:DNA-binding response OmpR family regulator